MTTPTMIIMWLSLHSWIARLQLLVNILSQLWTMLKFITLFWLMVWSEWSPIKLWKSTKDISRCPGSVCSSTFAQGETVRVTVTRLGEQLDLFDLQNDYMPNIVVLGCSFGMVNFGICEKANYYDNIIQRDDNVCICQGTSMKCDADTRTGGW